MRHAYGSVRLLLGKAFEQEEISFSQWIVLICLCAGVARTAADLSRGLDHDSGSLTRLIDQLEGRNLVKRCPNATDRRVHELVLTPEGRAMLDTLTPVATKVYDDIFSALSQPEIETLLRLLHEIIAAAKPLNAQHRTTDRRIEP